MVRYGLAKLRRQRLLEASFSGRLSRRPPGRLSRRQLLGRAAVVVPVIASLTLPGRAGVSMISNQDCAALIEPQPPPAVDPCPALPCDTPANTFCIYDDFWGRCDCVPAG